MISYTLNRLQEIYSQPFFDLIQQARTVYFQHWQRNEIQLCTLLSIKTGGCSEDCSYCAQSARYKTGVPRRASHVHRGNYGGCPSRP